MNRKTWRLHFERSTWSFGCTKSNLSIWWFTNHQWCSSSFRKWWHHCWWWINWLIVWFYKDLLINLLIVSFRKSDLINNKKQSYKIVLTRNLKPKPWSEKLDDCVWNNQVDRLVLWNRIWRIIIKKTMNTIWLIIDSFGFTKICWSTCWSFRFKNFFWWITKKSFGSKKYFFVNRAMEYHDSKHEVEIWNRKNINWSLRFQNMISWWITIEHMKEHLW